ncbi:MAG: zf-HC2 domain-containing protein [Planctomycetota bacterium]|nr:zf-HC2 domain-containing protein [Planctomycetota bacterium]
MANETIPNDGWSPCPKGTLTGLASTLKRRERIQRLQRVSSLVAVLLIAVAAGTWFANRSSDVSMENNYGGITCTEVRDSLPQMVSGKADESLVARINAHLAECPQCAEMARKMKEREMHAAAGHTPEVSGVQQHSVLLASDIR